MRTMALVTGLVAVAAAMASARGEDSSAPERQTVNGSAAARAAGPEQRGDERAIRLVVDAFAKAYNARDAKALAALFTRDAQIVDEDGNTARGREAIERVFGRVFSEHPQGRIEIAVQSIRFVSPAVAVEEGSSTVTRAPGEPPERSRYMVVHVNQDGRWQMGYARDLSEEAASAETELKQLQWLIGDWVDESPDSLIVTSYRWADGQHYILGQFTVQIGGRPAMTGSQRIGWDPLAKKIRSWVFDSEGGFAEGLWTREGNRWIVKMTGVTREGKPASATNVTTRINKDRMTWESRDRVVGGETNPAIEPVPIVRKPPSPK